KQLVNVRILGFLLQFGPGHEAQTHVAKIIESCPDDDAVFASGEFFDKFFIRTFRKHKVLTPTSSRSQSRSSSNTVQDMIGETLVECPQNHQEAKHSVSILIALIRDGFRCVLSGAFDLESVIDNRELQEIVLADSKPQILVTQGCHIFPESSNMNLENQDKAAKVHSLANVLTLEVSIHTMFDNLQLWLEPTPVPNRYKVGTSRPFITRMKGLPSHVDFTANDSGLDLPSEKYLRIHAACCQVAHMSGTAKYLDDMEDEDPFDGS
ncbi:hypothetical protein FISHEDRAFT_6470, partial [Fistulina hepatica ATCC 64428]